MTGRSTVFGRHVRRHLVAYSLSVALLVMGVVFGSLATARLTPAQEADLVAYLETYVNGFRGAVEGSAATPGHVMLAHSLLTQGKALGLSFVLGLTAIGAPGILVLLFAKGFLVGFTVGFLTKEYLLKGVVLAFAAVLPHNLVALPAMVFMSVIGLSFAWDTVRGPSPGIRPAYKRFPRFAASMLAVGVLLAFSSLIEAYVTPVFIGWVSAFI